MKFTIALCLLCNFFLSATSLTAADISGDWELAGKHFDEVIWVRITLKVDGEKLSGNLNELKLEGTLKREELMLTATRPNGTHFGDFKGYVKGEQLEGTAEWSGDGKLTWSARRPVVAPKEPRVHHF